jgi:5-formyltetrahydrofolate cyclo-ligase
MTTKPSLRSSCIAKRDAISASDHEIWSFAVCEKLALYLSALPVTGKQLALYNPTHSELDITPVLHALDAEGITVGLPVVEENTRVLSFFRFFSTLPMNEGAFGIMEPQHFEQITPDIVVVPLVGFDRSFQRIGYGKGYYDATLKALREHTPSLLAIGVGFSEQEIDAIPKDRHDEKLNAIITEKEIITP